MLHHQISPHLWHWDQQHLLNITNTQLVIAATPPLRLAIWLIQFTSVFQSCICLLCPNHCSIQFRMFLVTLHSKNKCENVSNCCLPKTQSGRTMILNFCNLSTVASLFCIANNRMDLYLGCIFGCKARCTQAT